MGKYFGKIGFGKSEEVRPGVWEDKITEREYYGEILQFNRRLESSGGVNDNINIANKISILADPFAYENFHSMRYIVFMGAKWNVSSVSVERPRLILDLGGVYNGA